MFHKLALVAALSGALTVSSVGKADAGFETDAKLKKAAMAKFLKAAHDPKSEIGKLIAKINEESADGRNGAGTISLPIKASDLQVVTVNAEEMHAPWHYAGKVNGSCRATGDSATFMILLSQFTNVHAASEFETSAFMVGAVETFSAKILVKDSDELYCEELVDGGSNSKFGPINTAIEVGDIKAIDLPHLY